MGWIRVSTQRGVAAQAAQAVIAEEQPGAITAEILDAAPRADLADTADALRQALDDLDEPVAQAVLDRLLTDFTVEPCCGTS